MTTDTVPGAVLTDEQRERLYRANFDDISIDGEEGDAAIKAIEQAVLQSEQVQRLREALSLVADLASQEWQEADGQRKAASDNQGRRFWFITEDVMQDVRAAMEKQ